jgi:hypothetical protein
MQGREWLEYFSLVIAAVEFTLTWKNAYQAESAGTPDDGDHQLCALNSHTWSLGNFFTKWKPNHAWSVLQWNHDSFKVTTSYQVPYPCTLSVGSEDIDSATHFTF